MNAASEEEPQSAAESMPPVFLFYLVVAVNGGMTADLAEINRSLRELRDRLLGSPAADKHILFGVLSFGSTARVEVPLGNLASLDLPPDLLRISGSNCYSDAFKLLKATIEQNLAAQRAKDSATGESRAGFRYYRPIVFFVTNRPPDTGDAWQQTFAELIGMHAYPIFVPMGLQNGYDVVLRELVHPRNRSKAYLCRPHGMDSVSELFNVVYVSMVATAMTGSQPAAVLAEQKDVGPHLQVAGVNDVCLF